MSRSTSHSVRTGLAVLLLVFATTPARGQAGLAGISGEIRTRSVFEHDLIAPGAQSTTLLRTRLGVRAVVSPRVGVFVQIQDARIFGEETSTLSDGSADQLDLHWAYVWIERILGEQPIRLEIGRQEIVLGNQRLVGAVGWSNTGRTFDAFRLHVGDDEAAWSVSAMAATVVERGRTSSSFAPGGPGDHVLLGVSVEGGSFRADVLFDADAAESGATGIDRTTVAGQWRPSLGGGVSLDLEGARQFGSRIRPSGVQDVRASFFGGRLDWVRAASPLRRAVAGIDWLSGDSSPNVGDYSSFKTLYATNHKFYGLMDFFLDPATRTGDRGLVDAFLTLQVPVADATITGTAHQFWVAEDFGLGPSDIGRELDLTSTIDLEESVALDIGYAFFRGGAVAPVISLGPEGSFRHWAFAQLTVRFQ